MRVGWSIECPLKSNGILLTASHPPPVHASFGKLPDDVPVQDNEAAAVLCAQVIHFIGPAEVERSFAQFNRVLAPGGKLVLLACAHYVIMNYASGRVAEIEARMKVSSCPCLHVLGVAFEMRKNPFPFIIMITRAGGPRGRARLLPARQRRPRQVPPKVHG